MRTILLFMIFINVQISVFSQTSIVTLSNLTRPVPKIGHMLNYLTKPAWSNQSFMDSVRALNLEIIRYPGGTESQYFDWQTGRSLPASLWSNSTLFNHSYIGTTPHVSYPLSELLYFYQQTGIKPIFCLNLLTKTLPNQIQMLLTADSLGIPVEYIELGNELYFTDTDFTNKYPNPIDYVLDIKNNWIPQLHKFFPNAKIAVIGGYDGLTNLNGAPMPTRIHTWNDTLFAQNVNTDAITFHYYVPPNTTTLSNPNITQALAAPFRHWPTLKSNTVDHVTNGMECWITEYNLTDGNQTTYAIASTWTHALYTASFFSLMLEEPKITMLLNHQIAGSPAFASLASYTLFGDTLTNRLTAEGNAMRLLHQAVSGNNTATKLNFSVNTTITIGPTIYPSLLGWVFENGTDKKLFVLNLSNTNFSLDLSSVINGAFEYEQISASASNPLQKDITTQNLNIIKGNSNTTVQITAYSIMYARTENLSGVNNFIENENLSIFPNPGNSLVCISGFPENFKGSISFYNSMGQMLLTEQKNGSQFSIETANLNSGIYFIQIKPENGEVITRKFIKQ